MGYNTSHMTTAYDYGTPCTSSIERVPFVRFPSWPYPCGRGMAFTESQGKGGLFPETPDQQGRILWEGDWSHAQEGCSVEMVVTRDKSFLCETTGLAVVSEGSWWDRECREQCSLAWQQIGNKDKPKLIYKSSWYPYSICTAFCQFTGWFLKAVFNIRELMTTSSFW